MLILKPGQCLHIDCHHALCEKGKNELGLAAEIDIPCWSVSWDWLNRGWTTRGIFREVMACLEAAILNRKRNRGSLAIPELSILKMAQWYAPRHISHSLTDGEDIPVFKDREEAIDVCRGMLPALQHIVREQWEEVGTIESNANDRSTDTENPLSQATRADTQEDPDSYPIDPYGSCDFALQELPQRAFQRLLPLHRLREFTGQRFELLPRVSQSWVSQTDH